MNDRIRYLDIFSKHGTLYVCMSVIENNGKDLLTGKQTSLEGTPRTFETPPI